MYNRVKEIRQRKNLTLQKLAKKAGIGKSTLSEIERGVHTPSFETMIRISKALGVSLDELFMIGDRENGKEKREGERKI